MGKTTIATIVILFIGTILWFSEKQVKSLLGLYEPKIGACYMYNDVNVKVNSMSKTLHNGVTYLVTWPDDRFYNEDEHTLELLMRNSVEDIDCKAYNAAVRLQRIEDDITKLMFGVSQCKKGE